MADTTMTPESPAWTPPPAAEDLEQRLQRLEDVVAAICDTQALEDRVVQKVTEKLSTTPAPAQSRDELPPHPSEAEFSLAKPSGVSKRPPTAALAPLNQAYVPPSGSTWITELGLFGEIWREVRALFRMVRDPIYKMSWVARIVPLLCLLYVTVWSWISAYFFGSIPVISMIDDLVVIYIGLKILGRELRRFREHEARYGRYT